MTRKFREEIIDFITEKLYEHKGEEVYFSDLASTLIEKENIRGYYITGYHQCLKFIGENIEEASETYYYAKDELDYPVNVFETPDTFVLMMLFYGVDTVLNTANFYDDFEDEITLDEDTIQTIIDKVISSDKEQEKITKRIINDIKR